MWVSAPYTTAWGTANQHMAVDSVTAVICQNIYNVTVNTLQSLGIPKSAIINSNLANGCAVVSPLPNAVTPSRIAYKLYFSVTPSQWAQINNAFHTASGMNNLVKYGHTMCGSTIYFQKADKEPTGADVSGVTQPSVSVAENLKIESCQLPLLPR